MPHHFPFARLLTQSFAIAVEAAPPPPQANARPRNRNWVAIVPTIALIPIPTISTAFSTPQAAPIRSANVTAPAVDQSCVSPNASACPLSAATPLIERSSPPQIITSANPAAMIPP